MNRRSRCCSWNCCYPSLKRFPIVLWVFSSDREDDPTPDGSCCACGWTDWYTFWMILIFLNKSKNFRLATLITRSTRHKFTKFRQIIQHDVVFDISSKNQMLNSRLNFISQVFYVRCALYELSVSNDRLRASPRVIKASPSTVRPSYVVGQSRATSWSVSVERSMRACGLHHKGESTCVRESRICAHYSASFDFADVKVSVRVCIYPVFPAWIEKR